MSLKHITAEEMIAATESLTSRVRKESISKRDNATDGKEWIDEWKSAVADADDAAFERRLDMLNVSEEEAIRRLASSSREPPHSIPEWVETLDELVDSLSGLQPEPPSDTNTDNVIPFEDVLRPIVTWWSQRINWGRYEDEITNQGVDDLENWLVQAMRQF